MILYVYFTAYFNIYEKSCWLRMSNQKDNIKNATHFASDLVSNKKCQNIF